MDDVYERFLTLAQRELSADDVRLLAAGETPPEAENVVLARLADGQHVVASFASPPKDVDALTRRLAMLASTFADALAAPTSERMKSRPPVVISLHEELKALALRAQAHDVVVIDGDSPVVWGCASISSSPSARNEMLLRDVSDRELSAQDEPSSPVGVAGLHAVPAADDSGPLQDPTAPTGMLRMAPPPAESAPMLSALGDHLHAQLHDLQLSDTGHDPGHDHEPGAHDQANEPEITRRAIGSIRALPSLDLLHKGRHLRHVSRGESSYLVLSFSSIYLLCLVFDGDFDELRAERAAQESLPRIERLVLALPPLDPDPQPMGGVVALRRPRARR
jgi:hypothetical protein